MKAYYVCGECNNGWMSRLQDEAKPIVQSLAEGHWPALSESDRKVLARWGAMTTVTLEFHGGLLAIPQHHRELLMKGDMPPGWHVTLARMADTRAAGSSFHRVFMTANEIKGQSSYFCVERFAVHAISVPGNATLKMLQWVVPMGTLDDLVSRHLLRRIWPNEYPFWVLDHPCVAEAELIAVQSVFGEVEPFKHEDG
jgi:hypothetical protein